MSLPLLKAISTSSTTIIVTGTITFPVNGGTILIESEKINYLAASDNQFLGCTRGVGGTSAAAHIAGKLVTLIDNVVPSASLGSDVVILKDAAVPVDGTAGTGVNVAEKGSLYINTDAGTLYQNTGTLASPTWTLFQAGTDLGITALTGAVTASGTGSVVASIATNAVTTVKILDANVTDAKIASLTSSKLVGALPAISGAALTNLPTWTVFAQQTLSVPADSFVAVTGLNVPGVKAVKILLTAGATDVDSDPNVYLYFNADLTNAHYCGQQWSKDSPSSGDISSGSGLADDNGFGQTPYVTFLSIDAQAEILITQLSGHRPLAKLSVVSLFANGSDIQLENGTGAIIWHTGFADITSLQIKLAASTFIAGSTLTVLVLN